MKRIIFIAILIVFHVGHSQSFQKTKGLEAFKGFFDFYYDASQDKIFLTVKTLNQDFLYVNSLAAGVGSNDLGLDRGKLGKTAVVHFQKAGNKLLLVQANLGFRAVTNNIEERKSVQEAFAQSVLEGFPIVESNGDSYLIDISRLLLSDVFGITANLRRNKQGSYRLDAGKSAMFLERTKAFPKNIEFEALLTFTGEAKGSFIRSVAPNSERITVRQHHSFIELPDDDYEMRTFDTRSGSIFRSYKDYATPIEETITKRFIVRHRLKKKQPNAPLSEPVEPIIYYLDRGAPEPIKSALLEGGSWWNQAFEAAGYKDAFQIKVLPEGVDPLDIRYNVVQWVHRSTRGWSYGGSVVDPRTGEILKGHVSLGSLRIRQDYLIAQALMGASEARGDDNPLLQMALARIRQLSAHEIGHTLGFTHNFAASYNNSASVMDYPHPKFKLVNGKIDLSSAYEVGIGEWDKVTVAYAYQDFADVIDEDVALNKILEGAIAKGFKFISDSDARAQGGAHPYAHLWDNGANPVTELGHVLKIRSVAMNNFSKDNILDNEPFSMLEDVFVPLYFLHRYQVEAVVKLIGGLNYSYAVKGDKQTIVEPVDPTLEKNALDAIVSTLQVETLRIPDHIFELFPPRAYGYSRNRETFKSLNGVGFDALSAAATAADFVAGLLLNPQRVSRMVQQKAFHEDQVGLDLMMSILIDNSFKKGHNNIIDDEIQQSINVSILQNMFALYASNATSFQAKSIIFTSINNLRNWLAEKDQKVIKKSYTNGYVRMIDEFLKQPEKYQKTDAPKIPDGSPIGTISCSFGHL